MASKILPVVGEAFLGSDPLVQKMIRVTFGSSGFSGVNDVDVSTAGGQTLLAFADSNFRILNVWFNITEAFSVGAIQVGIDTSPTIFGADTLDQAVDFTAISNYDLRYGLSTGVALASPLSSDFLTLLGVPADSIDVVVVSFSGAGALGTEGNCEMYVFYLEVPDQP